MNSDWFAAAERGDIPTLASLLERGVEVDTPGEYGWTALMFVAYGRHIEATHWLLSRGANPNQTCNSQKTPVTFGILSARGWQLEAGRCRARLEPDPRILNLLMAAGGRLGLREAILLGDVELARRIIEEDASIDINGESEFGMHDTFLMLAAHVGPVAMVDLLLEKGADIEGIDDIGATALMMASEMGRLDVVDRLIERGAKINRGWPYLTALHQANEYGHADVVARLLACGAKWGEPDPWSARDTIDWSDQEIED